MNIEVVKVPKNISTVRYGICQFLVSDDHTLSLPDYVAKTLLTLSGFTCDNDLSSLDEVEALRALTKKEAYAANYIFMAYNKDLGALSDRVERAAVLMEENGAPTVSAQ